MNLFAVFDISSFIWDQNHFEENKASYFNLMQVLPNIYEEIQKNKIPVVFRDELRLEIEKNFPYNIIPNEYYDFQWLTLSFLTKVNMIDYPSIEDVEITCHPNLIKNFFHETTKTEIRHLIRYLYTEDCNISKLLIFSIFWEEEGNLVLFKGTQKEIETCQCDCIDNHKKIIDSMKKNFEHNPKHNRYKSSMGDYCGEQISPLSCYNERNGDKTEAQKLLDESIYYKNDFFNFDKNNDTYVIFVHTRANIYHGFDIKPSDENIVFLKIKKLNNE